MDLEFDNSCDPRPNSAMDAYKPVGAHRVRALQRGLPPGQDPHLHVHGAHLGLSQVRQILKCKKIMKKYGGMQNQKKKNLFPNSIYL